eukprot:2872564-Rhodomonas_salina.3
MRNAREKLTTEALLPLCALRRSLFPSSAENRARGSEGEAAGAGEIRFAREDYAADRDHHRQAQAQDQRHPPRLGGGAAQERARGEQ